MHARWIYGLMACSVGSSMAASSGCGLRAEASSALLVTLDATRADAVGVYGGPAGVTPHLDRLAREGITYALARSVAPLALPAQASISTGLYPPRHGVRSDERAPLSPSAITLAEAARSAALDTAAFVASGLLGEDTGLGQGFDTWDGPARGERGAEEVARRAAEWLRQRPGTRFFLWVQFADARRPWEAPEPFAAEAHGDAYLAEVARADAALGLLVEELRTLGLLERTAIAVVGERGEPRGEHGERTHGHFVYEGALRVPFVVRPAAGSPAGERRGSAERGAASVADVAPTLARALGIAWPAESDGIDLLAGPIPPERAVYFECLSGFLQLGWSPLLGWADARTKYIHSSAPELYLPGLWPDERVNRIHERSAEEATACRERLALLAAGPPLEAGAGAALGELLGESSLPSPHARAAELERCEQAEGLLAGGRRAEALGILREIAAMNPRNTWALEALAGEARPLSGP